MKVMLSYIVEAAAFLWTLSLLSKLFTYLGYNFDNKSIAIGFLLFWMMGKMALRKYLIKLDEKNASTKKNKGKSHL